MSDVKYRVAAADRSITDLKVLYEILDHSGFIVDCFWSGTELLKFAENNKPDLFILDRRLIDMDGFEAMNRLHLTPNNRDIPVIISDFDVPGSEAEALSAGAADFIRKPYEASVTLFRVGNLLELKRLQSDLRSEVIRMTSEIVREHEKNEKLSMQIVRTLAGTIDAKDSYTNGHSVRVAEYSQKIALAAGFPEKSAEDIYMIGLLHDVGKIGIPDSVINKPSKLNDEEYALIKTHPEVGYNILKNITEMPNLAIGARWHHERFDGKGYPDGLSGYDIPEEARIVAVADAYDAMSSRRSYHNVFDQDYIRNELIKGKGKQFDPKYADIMITMINNDRNYLMHEHTGEAAETAERSCDAGNEEMLGFLGEFGINTSAGLEACMNDFGFYSEMLREFCFEYKDRTKLLDGYFEAENLKKYKSEIKSFKNLVKITGAEELAEMMNSLEEAARRNNIGYIAEKHSEMISGLVMTAGIFDEALKKIIR